MSKRVTEQVYCCADQCLLACPSTDVQAKSVALINVDSILQYPKLEKYWRLLTAEEQKNLSFDVEGLYSYTPFILASQVAAPFKGQKILDLFCGAGGLAIAFAKAGNQVTAIDCDARRLTLACANSQRLHVREAITFIHAEAGLLLKHFVAPVSVVLFDPPWGGMDYAQRARFTLADFAVDLKSMIHSAWNITHQVILRLPYHFQLADLNVFESEAKIKIAQYADPFKNISRPLFLTATFTRLS